jgi:hypothetical protein
MQSRMNHEHITEPPVFKDSAELYLYHCEGNKGSAIAVIHHSQPFNGNRQQPEGPEVPTQCKGIMENQTFNVSHFKNFTGQLYLSS